MKTNSAGSKFARALWIVPAVAGLAYALHYLPLAEATDDLRFLEGQLLQGKLYSASALSQILESAPKNLSPCDSHAQAALVLAQLKLAEIDLRNGAAASYDEKVRSARMRTSSALTCSPHASFLWLLAFNFDVLQGQVDQRSTAKLAMSFKTSPSESWIAIRRLPVTLPFLSLVNGEISAAILQDFRRLILNNFLFEASAAYRAAPAASRQFLDAEIATLGPQIAAKFKSSLREVAR